MNKLKHVLVILAIAVTLGGCARSAPILTPSTSITYNLTAEQVKKAILQAGVEREWVMTSVAPGIIDGELVARGHSAKVRITYSNKSYTIEYVSSQNLSAEGGKIHRNYNRWVNNLDKDIKLRLSTL